MAKHLFQKADGGVFQTKDAQKWFPLPIQKISEVIYNPINDAFFGEKYHPIANNVVTCGRLEEQKNQEMLVVAFSEVIKKYPDAHLNIYGEGGLRERLHQQIVELHLENNVFLMGKTSDVPAVLGTAQIFVLPSRYEGMPNALMEAMAVGVPCISTDCPCGGPQALLESGKNGILVPVGDTNALANAIMELLADEGQRKRYSRNAKKAAENYTQEKICNKWLSYIGAVVGR